MESFADHSRIRQSVQLGGSRDPSRGAEEPLPCLAAGAPQSSRPWQRVILRGACAALAQVLVACEGVQSALEPSGAGAARIADLWWLLFGISAFVFVVVSTLLLLALLRSPRPEADQDSQMRRLHRAMTLGVAATTVLLVVIFIPTLVASRPLAPSPDPAFTIRVTGKLWWWEVTYLDDEGAPLFTTANELRIPTGRTVRVELVSDNVIHSFWVPRLAGKVDLVPGRTNQLTLHATEEGTYRGQCAEFCGVQHAKMAFWVVASDPESYEEWVVGQRSPAVEPTDAVTEHGRQVFLEAGCGECHTVRGLVIGQEPGPDLTHLASRHSLAAGTLPNRPGYLSGWIGNPQALKPGNQMPRIAMAPADFHSLLAYLEALE